MKRFFDYFSRQLRRIEIRYRLIGSFVLLSLLPLVVSGYISYSGSTKAIAERTRVFSTEVVKQVSKNIQLEMAKIDAETEGLVLSPRVQDALAQFGGDKEMEQEAARAELTRILLERYGSFDFINQKYFLDKDNRILDAQVFAQLGQGIVQFVERAPDLRGRSYWSSYANSFGQKSMVLLRAIYSKGNNRQVGKLFIGIQPSHFAAIFDDVDLGSGTDIFVLDGADGSVIVRKPERDSAGDAALADEIRRSLLGGQQTGFFSYAGQDGDKYLAAYSQLPGSVWFVVSTIPVNKLITEAQSVRNQMSLIGLLCFVIAIALAVIISRSISYPLAQLVHSMRETESGNYANRMQPEGSDELTALARKFNEMAAKVDQTKVRLEERVDERTRDLADANSKLAALSLTDSLTGIANRRRFDEALAAELHRAARARTPLALMMLDVDYFKNYNDLNGHQEGDACLRQLARLLQSHSRRASDLVARYGGEEFVLIAADTNADAALVLAEAIRHSFEALRLPHGRSPLGCVTTSIGVVVVIPDEDMTPDELMRMADKAMYSAKEQGRNQVVLSGRKVSA